jgi:hypothetical protein
VKALVIALVIASIELAVLWIRNSSGRLGERSASSARWRVASYSDGDRTTVAVRLVDPAGVVLDEHVVARVPADAYDRLRSLLQAELEAESRAMHLNGVR